MNGALGKTGSGRWFEDFAVGDVFRHPLGRTVTDTDNAWFTLLTMNTNQLHFNDHYSSQAEFGRQLVNSGLSVAMVLGISVSDISQNAVANLGWEEIRLLHPLFVGDTLYADSVITEVRASNSRPHAGVVSCFTRGLNQYGETILTFRRSVMVHRRDSPAAPAYFPAAAEPITDVVGLSSPSP
ncbi:MaoC family dehydratase [Mycobacterium sp. NPDC003449]